LALPRRYTPDTEIAETNSPIMRYIGQENAMQPTPAANTERYQQLLANSSARAQRRRRFTQLLRAMHNRTQLEAALATVSNLAPAA
jgi:DNA-binding transcriptional regulator/RsmH inhibitor MraZ